MDGQWIIVCPLRFLVFFYWAARKRQTRWADTIFLGHQAVPSMIDKCACPESSVFPIIMVIPLLVECQPDSSATAIDLFPFAGEDMEIADL